MLFADNAYTDAEAKVEDFLVEVPDFNSLIAISQMLSKPVFELRSEDLGYSVNIAQNQIENAEKFKKTYAAASKKINKLIFGK